MNFLNTPIEKIKGVGASRAKQLGRLGIFSIRDLIHFFPRGYEKRGDIKPVLYANTESPAALLLTVGTNVKNTKIRNGLTISKFRAFDESGAIEVVFFNSPYVKDVFTLGATFRFFGKITVSKNKAQLIGPKYEPYIEGRPLDDFVPVYHLTEGLSSKIIGKLVLSVIDEALFYIKDCLPEDVRIKENLPTINFAIKNAHFPQDEKSLMQAIRRLAFDEMLTFAMGISLQSRYKSQGFGIPFSPCKVDSLTSLLPYELTDDQKATVNDIYKDMVIKDSDGNVKPMARIVVGDVGSGKTVCAIIAMYIAAKSSYQSALMVPTEILARQHFADVSELFAKLGIKTELLLGNTSAKDKKRIYSGLANGDIDVVIGTHALMSDKIDFSKLGLIITDEQHRFGVSQRAVLKERTMRAHVLVMSATPIPRTLALAMYGDLDVSKITTMPKGRMRVDTFVVDESYRKRLDDFISKQVALGGQCYIVCPAIESKGDDECDFFTPESEDGVLTFSSTAELKNAIEYTEELKKRLPNLRIEVLHGKMKSTEKDDVMHRFSAGEVDVLVSTTVIEVGVNVPNATLMIVENAERFGLAQLHQLRGRVGRGTKKSYCVLVSDSKSEKASMRLDVMKTTYDGYEIAEKDLVLRGPGDFFSSKSDENLRQSGGLTFKFTKLCNDNDLLSHAFSTAKEIVLKDPTLDLPEHNLLKETLEGIMNQNSSNIS